MSLERLWAGWRTAYVSDPNTGRTDTACVMCNLVTATDDREALVLERTPQTITVMNLYPVRLGAPAGRADAPRSRASRTSTTTS